MIASILVDVKAKEVDKTFDYKVPTYLENVIEIGQRVKVPFGPRLIMGYVLNIKNTSEYNKLKEIKDILDITPSLTEELINLGHELSISNTSPLVSIYQVMLPSALKSKYKKKLKAKDTAKLSLPLALNFNKFKETVFDDSLKAHFKEIKEQIKSNNLEVIYEVKQRNKERYLKKIRLINSTIPVKGSKQKQVIEYLLKKDNEYKRNIMYELDISNATIKSLIDKGIIEEYNIEVYREVESLYKAKDKEIILNEEQHIVYDELKSSLNNNEVFLLKGVTGSGKTEIYLNIIEDVIKSGKEAIMLVPEISLTPMMVSRFKGRFNDDVALLHSGLSIGEKFDEWRKIRRKEVKVCVGARSAIFAPFENLGIIIIDEEHTDSYKQTDNPRYHALDIAKIRCKTYNIPLVLGSATPSIESYYNAQTKEYKLLEITKRANNTKLPHVYIEDMRYEFEKGNRSIFSKHKK